MKKQISLLRKSLTQFIFCVVILLLLATPLFYWLTKSFYAEDMIDIIEAVQQGYPIPALDLEEDIIHGVVIQFVLIVTILSVAIVLMMRFISKRLWQPFDQTLRAIETFRLETGEIPSLSDSTIIEFTRLNAVLNKLMTDSVKSYCIQKEFTENASHELQTPLAVFQSKLDILLQQPGLTEQQAVVIQDLYQISGRLSHLNRSLLLLAKMENSQFSRAEVVDVITVLNEQLPYLESLSEDFMLKNDSQSVPMSIKANRSLLESLINNLVVNAVRHNKPGGEVIVVAKENYLTVSNTSNEKALDEKLIFNRFYSPSGETKGCGLGLAIVKAVCDYHGWKIAYTYRSGWHVFTVVFG